MNHNKHNAKEEPLDTHLRLFNKVMCDRHLTLLQKVILSDVISFQIHGKQYFKTSAQLAKQLGRCATKTIQNNFQWLNDNGYLDSEPYKRDGSQYSLREARVVQLERWVHEDEYLSAHGINVEPLEKKDVNHPLKSVWPNSRKGDAPIHEGDSPSTSQAEQPTPVENHNWESYDYNWHDDSDESELTIGHQPKAAPQPNIGNPNDGISRNDGKLNINGELLNFMAYIRARVLEEKEAGRTLNYHPATITIGDLVYDAEVVLVNDNYNPQLKYMTRQFVETGVPL